MDATTKSRVRDRAENRCEYCRIHQQHYIKYLSKSNLIF